MRPFRRHTTAIAAMPVAVTVALVGAAPPASADATFTLHQALTAARATSNCPAFGWNPLLQRGAQMANQSTSDYVNFEDAAVPFTDPMPALKTIGYPREAKGMLLSGSGATEADALRGLVLQYQAFKPDCTFIEFGVDAALDPAGYHLASAILVAPS